MPVVVKILSIEPSLIRAVHVVTVHTLKVILHNVLKNKGIFPAYSGSFCDPVLLNALSMAAFLAFSSA